MRPCYHFGNKKVHESVIKLILMSNNISSSSHSSKKTCSYLGMVLFSYKTKIMNLYFHVSLLMKILSPSLRSIALSIPTIVHNVILILALSHLICCSEKKLFRTYQYMEKQRLICMICRLFLSETGEKSS